MPLLLGYAVVLVAAVLVSERARRTVLSTAVLFLAAGFGYGALVRVPPVALERPLAELALFAVLFTDAMRVTREEVTRFWRLPGRALLLGLPLTGVGTAVLARWVAGLPWLQALLVGAVLSPTDPVFAAAIVGEERIPARLRHLLNVESGLNDGLALPIVLVLVARAAAERPHVWRIAAELGGGVAIGVVLPIGIVWLERTRVFGAARSHQPLLAFSAGLLVLAVAGAAGANLYLAAFAAGQAIAWYAPEVRARFGRFGELLAELLKLAALFVFGARASTFLPGVGARGWLFAALALVAVRPVALAVALFRSGLGRAEFLAAAWFGPKGFASVVYALLVLYARIPDAERVARLVGAVIVLSMVAHSSTDVVVAQRFRAEEAGAGKGRGPTSRPGPS